MLDRSRSSPLLHSVSSMARLEALAVQESSPCSAPHPLASMLSGVSFPYDMSFLLGLEVACQELSYCVEVHPFKIPFPDTKGKGPAAYTVEKVSAGWGLEAYGLLPPRGSQHSPLLLFHGTRLHYAAPGAGMTLLANMDPLGVCYLSFQSGAPAIQQWLERAHHYSGKKVIVAGHSQGGVKATYAAIEDAGAHVEAAITFAAPGISWLAARDWEKKVSDPQRAQPLPALFHFRAVRPLPGGAYEEADVVPSLGQVSPVGTNIAVAGSYHYPEEGSLLERMHALYRTHIRMQLRDATGLSIRPRPMHGYSFLTSLVLLPVFCLAALLLQLKRRLVGGQGEPRWSYVLGWLQLLVEGCSLLLQRIIKWGKRQATPTEAQKSGPAETAAPPSSTGLLDLARERRRFIGQYAKVANL